MILLVQALIIKDQQPTAKYNPALLTHKGLGRPF
jgi:hypothetical protein